MPARRKPTPPIHADTPTLFGWDLPVSHPDPDLIYTCTQCGGHRPLAPLVATVDPRWWLARCIDCSIKSPIVFSAQERTPSHDSTTQPDGGGTSG
jgi:hypothetical protein